MVTKSAQWLRSIPLPLLRNALLIAVLGVCFIYSASFRTFDGFAGRQIAWIAVGLVFFFVTVQLGYRFFLGISYVFYLFAIACLVWVDVAGEVHLGAQRWIELGPFSFQPSEFAKLAAVLSLANFLGSHPPWEGEGRAILTAGFLVGLPFLLVMKQPDLGTATLFLPLGIVVLFLWGLRYRYLIVALLSGLLVSPFVWSVLKAYQKKRILVFMNPNLDPLGAGYTAVQSKIAVGSGGLFGKGWLHGTQSQLDFIPEHHTDFIFSVIAEEMGFVGSLALLFLFGSLFYQIFLVIDRTTDAKARLLGAGLLAIMFFQVLVNVGMTFGVLPITGITLPLISYGGSSLVSNAIALGLLVSVHKGRSIF